MNRLICGVLFGAVLLVSSMASATTGYVCYGRRTVSSIYGSAGATHVTYYSQPDCAGSFLGQRYYCSAGATSTNCANSATYQYGAAELNTFLTVFQTAAVEGSKIAYYDTACVGGGSADCPSYFYFYGTP